MVYLENWVVVNCGRKGMNLQYKMSDFNEFVKTKVQY